MWDMDDKWINHDRMKAILMTFLMKGGMISTYGNTPSVLELEAAMRNPERYPNLIVRVGGFSARFIMLSADLHMRGYVKSDSLLSIDKSGKSDKQEEIDDTTRDRTGTNQS